jgi:hypothetical protein
LWSFGSEISGVLGVTLHHEEWLRAYVVLKEGLPGSLTEQGIQGRIKARVAKHKWLAGGVAFVDEVPKSGEWEDIEKDHARVGEEGCASFAEAGQSTVVG